MASSVIKNIYQKQPYLFGFGLFGVADLTRGEAVFFSSAAVVAASSPSLLGVAVDADDVVAADSDAVAPLSISPFSKGVTAFSPASAAAGRVDTSGSGGWLMCSSSASAPGSGFFFLLYFLKKKRSGQKKLI